MSSLATPRERQQCLELRLVDEVAAHLVLEVGGPVELDGALDVALVVGGRVLVDLDEDDLRVVEMVLHPLGGDESGVAAHWFTFLYAGSRRGVWSAGGRTLEEQVDLAAEAEAEDRVEQGGREGEAGGDECDDRRGRPRSRAAPTTAKPSPTACANRGGRGSSRSCGAPSRGRTSVRNSPGVRRVLDAAERPDREDHGLEREHGHRDRRRGDQHEREQPPTSGTRRTADRAGRCPSRRPDGRWRSWTCCS